MYLFYIIGFMAQQLLSVPLNRDFFLKDELTPMNCTIWIAFPETEY